MNMDFINGAILVMTIISAFSSIVLLILAFLMRSEIKEMRREQKDDAVYE